MNRNKERVDKEGVFDILLPKNSQTLVMVTGNKISYEVGNHRRVKKVLPGKPKWMWESSGNIIPFPIAKHVFVSLREISVNPFFKKDRLNYVMKKWSIDKKDRKSFILDVAKSNLMRADANIDSDMMKKCKWVCKIYTRLPLSLPAEEVSGEKRIGAVAFMTLGVIGG